MKYIVVTGGVLSGLGKGITASSIGCLLISRGFKVTAIKIDPYLNCDAGTMNPFQHGEVYVLDDGGEVDMDLGNYERFLDVGLTKEHNITTGKIYKSVIEKERRGEYLGNTVQIIPHITNEIKYNIKKVSAESGADICIIELGGTVGDIESMPFLEAVRQLRQETSQSDVIFVHTTLVPILKVVGEMKTKPTQHSVKELRSLGIQPDIIIGRCTNPLDKPTKEKISLFCSVPEEAVISAHDVKSIYQVPLVFEDQKLVDYLLKIMRLEPKKSDLRKWRQFVHKIMNLEKKVKIAVVGKYVHLKDSYVSHIEAFHHVEAVTNTKIILEWIEAEDVEEKGARHFLEGVDGVLIPGGFGKRGVEGKVLSMKYAREAGIPLLGVCLGFQLVVVEFSRNMLGYSDAHSTEFNKNTPHAVVDLLSDQRDIEELGGTMHLGSHKVLIKEGSLAHSLYGKTEIYERHRHRYEVNPDYIEEIESRGLIFSGRSEDGKRMEIAELMGHPFYISCQFHPEFKSRPGKPSPLHLGLVKAAIRHMEKRDVRK